MIIEQVGDTAYFTIKFAVENKLLQDYLDGKVYGIDFEAELHHAIIETIAHELHEEIDYIKNKNTYGLFEEGWLQRQIQRAAKEVEHWTESKKQAMSLTHE